MAVASTIAAIGAYAASYGSLAATALGASSATAGVVGGVAAYGTAAAAYGAVAYGAYAGMASAMPDAPATPKPEAQVQKGEEGIRRGETARAERKRELGALYLTRGSRANDSTLGAYTQALGG